MNSSECIHVFSRSAFSAIGLLFFSVTLRASHPHDPLHDLKGFVEYDARIVASRALHQSRRSEADAAQAIYLPTVRGIGSTGSSQSSDPLTRSGNKRTYGIEIEQPIPIFGRESARVELARMAVLVEAAEVRRVEQAVLAEILENLATLEAATVTKNLRDQLAANLTEQTAAAHEAVAGGGMKLTEERQLLSRKAQAYALRARAAADQTTAQMRLQRLLPPETPIESISRPTLQDFWHTPLSAESLESAALRDAPALAKARAEADQATAEHELARAEFWPKLSITYQNLKGTNGGVSADSHSTFIGLNVPLYEGGATTSRAQSAAFKRTAALERSFHEERMTRQRIAEAWERWQAAEAMVSTWADAERQEDESVALVETQLTAGGTTLFGLLRARQTRLETRLQGAEYRAQRELAWIKLLQEAGALTLPATTGRSQP